MCLQGGRTIGRPVSSRPGPIPSPDGQKLAMDISDGKRLAIIAAADQAGVVQDKVVFVSNFFEHLRKIAPGKK